MFLFARLARPVHVSVRMPALAAPAPDEGTAAEEGPPCFGCGWFDSSLDLRQGLEVMEHMSLGPVARDLPVAWWLQ